MAKQDTNFVILRCTPEDKELFDAAALATNFTRMRVDQPNRSAWALAVLRATALDVVKAKSVEEFSKTPKRKKKNGKS